MQSRSKALSLSLAGDPQAWPSEAPPRNAVAEKRGQRLIARCSLPCHDSSCPCTPKREKRDYKVGMDSSLLPGGISLPKGVCGIQGFVSTLHHPLRSAVLLSPEHVCSSVHTGKECVRCSAVSSTLTLLFTQPHPACGH